VAEGVGSGEVIARSLRRSDRPAFADPAFERPSIADPNPALSTNRP